MLAKSSWVSLGFLIYHIAQTAFTKVLFTAGANALRKSGFCVMTLSSWENVNKNVKNT
jgi:hypothetical protein